jgi:hypothetical protein
LPVEQNSYSQAKKQKAKKYLKNKIKSAIQISAAACASCGQPAFLAFGKTVAS